MNEAMQELQKIKDAMASYAAKALDLLGTGSVLIPIEGTDQYVVAGTLPMIAKVLPADDAAHLAGQSQATRAQAADLMHDLMRFECVLTPEGKAEMYASETGPYVWFDHVLSTLDAPTAQEVTQQAAPEDLRECVRNAVTEALAGLYYCGRVWSAWGVGTMSQDDFSHADEDDDIIENVTDAAINAMVLANVTQQAAKAETAEQAVPATLYEIGKLITTQDNRYTDQPMFIVQQRRRLTGFDTDYCDNIVWMCSEDDYSEASAEEAAKLESDYQESGRVPSGWMRTGYVDQWEFVTACFTEQGCKDYLARDGHNLKEPRIYAEGSYRNEEFRSIRNWLKDLAPTTSTVSAPEEVAQEAARWRFMMRIADNAEGPEAEVMTRLGNEAMESDRPESVQLAELVDEAIRDLKRTTSGKGDAA